MSKHLSLKHFSEYQKRVFFLIKFAPNFYHFRSNIMNLKRKIN